MKKGSIIVSFLLACSGFTASQTAQPVFIGSYKSFEKTAAGISLKAENARISVSCYSPTIIRIRISQDPAEADFSYAVVQEPGASFKSVNESKDSLLLTTDSLQLTVRKNPVRFIFRNNKGEVLSEDYSPLGTGWLGTEVTTYRRLFPDERFLGLGEKTGNLDRRGEKYEMWNSDIPGYSAIADPLYVSIPFFIGIHNRVTYGIFLDNSYRTKFNFGASTDDQFSCFSAAYGEMNYYFFGGSTIARILEDYTWLTGRTPLPPFWSLGYQQCRWGYYPESEVMTLAQTFRDKKIPCDVIYLDIDYMEGYKIFTWNKDRFPDPKAMIAKLNSMGFHVATIVDPGIKIEKGYFAYEEGLKDDLFVKYPDGSNYTGSVWPGRVHFPDFTKEATRTWWGNSFTHLIDPGVEGLWNDMNEPSAWGQAIPDILKLDFDGRGATMARAHNVYGLEMSRATYEGTRNLLRGRRPFVLTRAAYAGIQRYSAVWTGDNVATDEHMLLSARMVNSMGLSGLSFVGPDMGGFNGTPTKALYERWLSLGVYTPFFRNHAAVDTKAKEPWAFGEDAERFSMEQISQRYRLLPYIYSAFYESWLTGLPVARSLAINYTFDEKVYQRQYQQEYLFGGQLLVAPVSCEQDFVRIFLPGDGWYRVSTDEYFKGNSEPIVAAPLNDLPVFARASAIIPLQSPVQFTAQKPSPLLELHIYRGEKPNSFLYYEDDGNTYEYEKGACYRRLITFDPAAKTIRLAAKEGSGPSKFSSVMLVLHGFGDIMGVKINGEEKTLKLKSVTSRTVEFPLPEKDVLISY